MSATLAAQPVWTSSESLGRRVFRVTVALFIAVVVGRIQEVVPGLTRLYLGKLLILPLLLATLAALPRWQLLSALSETPAKCMAIITALCALSVPMSVWPSNSAHFLVFVLVPALVLFVVTSAGFADRKTARLCVMTLVVCAGGEALYMLAGLSPTKLGRAYIGTGLDPNESAAFFVFILPFAMMFASERGSARWLGLVAPLLIAGLAKTASRGGMVGFVIVALVLIVQAVRRRRWSYVVGVVACSAAFALAAGDFATSRFRTMLAPEEDYNVTESEGRIEVWKRGMRLMATHPLVGVGLDGFETAEGTISGKVDRGYGIRYTAAHNAFVQIGAELGVAGLLAFVTAFASAAAGCRRVQRLARSPRREDARSADRDSNLAAALLCAVVAVITTGFFLSFAYHPITLFTFGACAGISAGAEHMWPRGNSSR
jgi:putative inorganic carbon (hco3(-)) transporter